MSANLRDKEVRRALTLAAVLLQHAEQLASDAIAGHVEDAAEAVGSALVVADWNTDDVPDAALVLRLLREIPSPGPSTVEAVAQHLRGIELRRRGVDPAQHPFRLVGEETRFRWTREAECALAAVATLILPAAAGKDGPR